MKWTAYSSDRPSSPMRPCALRFLTFPYVSSARQVVQYNITLHITPLCNTNLFFSMPVFANTWKFAYFSPARVSLECTVMLRSRDTEHRRAYCVHVYAYPALTFQVMSSQWPCVECCVHHHITMEQHPPATRSLVADTQELAVFRLSQFVSIYCRALLS